MTAFAMGAMVASTARSIPIFNFIALILYRIKTNAGRPLFVIQGSDLFALNLAIGPISQTWKEQLLRRHNKRILRSGIFWRRFACLADHLSGWIEQSLARCKRNGRPKPPSILASPDGAADPPHAVPPRASIDLFVQGYTQVALNGAQSADLRPFQQT